MSTHELDRLRVDPSSSDMRLDRFLTRQIKGMSRSAARLLIERGSVLVNGRKVVPSRLLSENDLVEVKPDPLSRGDSSPLPEPSSRLVLVYEDADVLILDKPAMVHCHPLRPDEKGTVANWLAAAFPECASAAAAAGGKAQEAGLCHRLDYETSGLLTAARTLAAHVRLKEAFRGHTVMKSYLAVVEGQPPDQGSVDAPFKKTQRTKRKVIVAKGPDLRFDHKLLMASSTRFSVLRRLPDDSALVAVKITSGRRHQIRAHLAHIGYPLKGDRLYGGSGDARGAFLLRAVHLEFDHPTLHSRMKVSAPFHPDFDPLLPPDWLHRLESA